MKAFERTALWSNAMSAREGDADNEARERLRAAYRSFWENAVTLSRQIQRDLPNLTLHDEAHFEALWARADQIAGPDYVLSPLEAFVFGAAILLHDAANTVSAYSGGLDEIRATSEWKDAAAEWLERQIEPPSLVNLPQAAEGPVLFEALRALHAQRAETLAGMSVSVADATYHLLPDDQLREHLGALIGLVAASHHWDVSVLQSKLPERVGALAGMPDTWSIRPVVLACLLRCADATQLDQQRAPDFLYALLQLRGVSELHWRAQNRLATPLVDPDDPRAMLFTSTRPFREADAEAWWIAFEALQVANRELQAADSLLRDLKLPPFAVNRIRNADSPKRLASQIIAKGWRPVSAEVKVTRVDKVVDMFGGEKLYGHDLSVPLRELIQNAADAVRYRRELEPPESPYEGKITVRLRLGTEAESPGYWLAIEDDGLGMSETVLIGPLLDFGASYISSALVKSERPGLLSKGRKGIGRFGIGFFSCFMISDEVSVTSRPFDQGLDHSRTLRFRNGIAARPLLLDTKPSDFGALLSTRVSLFLTPERKDEMLTFGKRLGGSGIPLTLRQLVGVLCPMLDVDVHVDDGIQRGLVHSRRWMEEERLSWLKRILIPELRSGASFLLPAIEAAAPYLTFIDPSDPGAGLAAVSSVGGGGAKTIGTLRASRLFSDFMDNFLGAIDHEPSGPRRSEGSPRAAALLPHWATDQAQRLATAELSPAQRHVVARRVAGFGGDATPVACMLVNREWETIGEIFDRLAGGETIYAPLKTDMSNEQWTLITMARNRHSGWVDSYLPGDLEYLTTTMEAGSDGAGELALYRIPTDADPAELSFCALLHIFAAERGFRIIGEILGRVDFAKYIGETSKRDQLIKGQLVGGPALKLSASPL